MTKFECMILDIYKLEQFVDHRMNPWKRTFILVSAVCSAWLITYLFNLPFNLGGLAVGLTAVYIHETFAHYLIIKEHIKIIKEQIP